VTLPLDGRAYDAFLEDMAKKYGGRKTLQTKSVSANLAGSVAV
jgi:hypothetical protein